MKSIRIALVALVAVFAISAVVASSALASPEWYAKKAGKFEKVTAALKVKGAISFELVNKTFPLPREVSCVGTANGEIKAGGAAAISSISLTSCKAPSGSYCKEIIGASKFYNLPWATELYTEGSEVRDRIVSQSKEPAWSYLCETVFAERTEEECAADTSTHVTNNVSGGLVEAVFDKNSAKTHCSSGGNAGEWKGTIKIESATSGVEAVKAE
jgi:hypothetical protein